MDYIKVMLVVEHLLGILYNLPIVALHYTFINTCHVLLLLLTVPMYSMFSTTKYFNLLGCIYVGPL